MSLTFVPPFDDRNGRVSVPIGFATFHNQAIISYFNYLGKPSTILLDWQDPWYSRFEDRALQRRMRSGASSFIYIEPFEVRHEILARVKDLEAWLNLDLEGNIFIEAHENETLKKRVGEFFLDKENMLIDGKKLSPILDRTAFVKYTMTGSQFLVQPERLPLSSARIGIIITYLTEGIPKRVENRWELWSERIKKVPTNAIDPLGPFPSYVTLDDNTHVWQNYLKTYKIPTIQKIQLSDRQRYIQFSGSSVICVILIFPFIGYCIKRRKNVKKVVTGIVPIFVLAICSVLLLPYTTVSMPRPGNTIHYISEEEAGEILSSLLKNIYRSFDFRQEKDVYDKLAVCIDGDILTEIYLQNRKSFEVKQAGGAQAKVKDIQMISVAAVSGKASFEKQLQFRTKWSATGSVGHWGHIHTRKNQYEALITIAPSDGAWKIINLELIEEKRIDPYAPS